MHDLALLRPKAVASHSINPIKVAPQDNIEVGADVHAISHPTGEAWTYTTGIVSQIRPDYEWRSGPQDVQHRATVIQVGVNAFGTKETQGLNFAISAKRFELSCQNLPSNL
jgi:S1-C subfamily serine protease